MFSAQFGSLHITCLHNSSLLRFRLQPALHHVAFVERLQIGMVQTEWEPQHLHSFGWNSAMRSGRFVRISRQSWLGTLWMGGRREITPCNSLGDPGCWAFPQQIRVDSSQVAKQNRKCFVFGCASQPTEKDMFCGWLQRKGCCHRQVLLSLRQRERKLWPWIVKFVPREALWLDATSWNPACGA